MDPRPRVNVRRPRGSRAGAACARPRRIARMNPQIYINGKLYDKADAKVSVFDHGLLYGDGVFEGIRAYSGRVFRLKQHVDRLYESARGIYLQIPISREAMAGAIVDTLAFNKLSDAY